MKYDLAKHNRKSIRLKDYDYAQEGRYFVTVFKVRLVPLSEDSKLVLQNGFERIRKFTMCCSGIFGSISYVMRRT